ncbi:MAG TPA: GntR family transcriptional regulator [Candidatus Acidoferrum sp.]|nr:GntR family transcriptional regulator [Candidatus Acidoferrum sp.]
MIVPYYGNMSKSSTLPRSSSVLAAISKSAAPLRRQVLDELRQSIIAGRLNPGERLVERELIAMMGVSRTVIREALRQLESEGLVAIVPNKGPIVRTLTVEEARDIYAIRAVLEGLAARLFTEQADQAQIARLERALSVVEKAYDSGDRETMLETKNNFYEMLFEGAKSETLASMLAILHGRIWRWRGLGLTHPNRSPERDRQSLKNLRALIQAIRARDTALAENILRDEVSKAAHEVHRLLRDGSPQARTEKPAVG